MRVFTISIIALIVFLPAMFAVGVAYTTPGAALRVFIHCRGEAQGFSGPILSASPAERRCLLSQAEWLAREHGFSEEVELRASLWDRSGPAPRGLIAAASRISRSEALLELADIEGRAPLAHNAGYGCYTAYPEAQVIIEAARPDPRSVDCQRLLDARPPRLNPRAVAEFLDWDGRCPDPRTERLLDDISLLPAAYAALAGDADAATCMVDWSEAVEVEGFYEHTEFWRQLFSAITGAPAPSERFEITALVDRVLSGDLLSLREGEQVERHLIL
jgi:hypothetical protein